MAAISLLNPKAEFARAAQALSVNISAAKGIQDVMKSNLGPKGTMKMYVTFSVASVYSYYDRDISIYLRHEFGCCALCSVRRVVKS
jgi:hypothetical protein